MFGIVGYVSFKGVEYKGQHAGIIDPDTFALVQTMLDANNASKTAYRAGGNKFLLQGLVRCAACHSFMTTSFSVKDGKRYLYYRCTQDNDKSKPKCRIASVGASQLEGLVVKELKNLGQDARILKSVIDETFRQQRDDVVHEAAKKKALQEKLNQMKKQARNLVAILAETGQEGPGIRQILEQLRELQEQEARISREIESIEAAIARLEGRIISAEVIAENLETFGTVYEHLTQEERYDLVHLLIKKIEYDEVP